MRLVFVHHSTGQNWLADGNGGLGLALRDGNYYVSDTNYGWGPDAIGDRTDIGHWYDWFLGPSRDTYTAALYDQSGQNCSYSRMASNPDPTGENEVVVFKSCFPNSGLRGNPSDPVPPIGSNPLRSQACGSQYHTVANAKGIYIALLDYFATQSDRLFVVIAAPPLSDSTWAANARAFNQWLVNDWLDSYETGNVLVFDFYNVLTSNGGDPDTNDLGSANGNHHRWWNGAVQHKTDGGGNTLAYPTGDDHPSQAGNLKATAEFVPLLNDAYAAFIEEEPEPEPEPEPEMSVSNVQPSTAPNNGSVSMNIAGQGFDEGAQVVLERSGQGDIEATGEAVAYTQGLVCYVDLTGAALGTWDVTVRNPDGESATGVGALTVTKAYFSTWYLAEGSSDWGFETYVTIQNPSAQASTAAVTYMTPSGPTQRPDVWLPANSQTVINPRNDIGTADFSTRVVCKEGRTIAVDRRMMWTGQGALSPEGHCSVGVTAPARTWYMPEGSSKWGFETWLLIQNPNTQDAYCTVTYMVEGGEPVPVNHVVPANSRSSFGMVDDIGSADASIMVTSSVPVIPERAMYRNGRREGHDSTGTTTPAVDCYLAEGSVGWGFTTYVLVQNPHDTVTDVTLTFMTPQDSTQTSFQMPPNSRRTVNVNQESPSMNVPDFSTHAHGSQSIITERAMYWDAGAGEACHDSIGMANRHMKFFLPDGETANGHETWTLVQNPNDVPVTVRVTYMTPDGLGSPQFDSEVPANSRVTFNMADHLPGGRAAVMVESLTAGGRIMCERAMYWNSRGAGTDTIGGFDD
ncbi:MAG: hypothetical protein KKF41_14190 [Actinobacteria bacterium]|nr:hypothetical protein [Actinomycetota bacterium]MBU1942601.1 hypothetical protein [Actinomycetota bacterium]MBU2688723.1 hypothetical protein [Actinomycetota bacterium]